MTTFTVARLAEYPLKSAQGNGLRTAQIDRMGFIHDRRWMVIDAESGMFVAQRGDRGLGIGIRSLCLIEPTITAHSLRLNAEDMPELTLPLGGSGGQYVPVQVWKDHLTAEDQGGGAAGWITEYLSRERPGYYRIVRMLDREVRPARRGIANVAFADADSCLIISEESLSQLNGKLARPILMNRFRPNIVISGGSPHSEDTWERIRINDIEFVGTTQCVRCSLTLTNQTTGVLEAEPLRTLATYRKTEKGVVFGKYFNPINWGQIRVGDAIEVLERKPSASGTK